MVDVRSRFLGLDGVRGVAAIAVMLFHCGLHAHAPWFAGHGSLAVDIFFVMSGFVVDRAYGERRRSGWSAAAFGRARFQRLYPLYVLGLVLGVGLKVTLLAWQGRPLPTDSLAAGIVFGMLLLPMLGGGSEQIFPLNGPSWSLFVEAVANLGFACLPRRHRVPCIAIAVAAGAAVVVAAATAGMPLLYGGTSAMLWLDLARGAFGFGVGILMSGAARGDAFRRVPRLPKPLLFAVLIALLLWPRGAFDTGFDPVAVLILSPAIVAMAVATPPCRAFDGVCRRLGALSYPLYVVHAPILDTADRLVPLGPGSAVPHAMAQGAAALLSVSIAWAVNRWIEPIFGAWMARPAHVTAPMIVSDCPEPSAGGCRGELGLDQGSPRGLELPPPTLRPKKTSSFIKMESQGDSL